MITITKTSKFNAQPDSASHRGARDRGSPGPQTGASWYRRIGFGRRPFLCGTLRAMDLHVKFDGHEIIVTRPGTDMMTAYRKRPDSPNLVLTRSWEKPTVTSPEISEFRAKAFQAAVSKARELGWIV
jgi:hypothetical protein